MPVENFKKNTLNLNIRCNNVEFLEAMVDRCNNRLISISLFAFRILSLYVALFGIAFTTPAQEQQIVVGVLENWPPQYEMDLKTGRPKGFAIDIMNAVGRLSGIDFRYKVFREWPRLNKALREKEIDIIPNMGITKERKALFNYTVPIETSKILFFARETSSKIKTAEDLIGHTVSVVETNKGRYLMEEKGWKDLKVYQSFDEALMSMISGVSDAFVYPNPPMMKILSQYGLSERVKVVGEPLLEIKRGIAVHKDNTNLIIKLNDAVKDLMTSAEYSRIYSKWYGPQTSFWSTRKVAVFMGSAIIVLGAVLLAWRFHSVTQLNKRLVLQIHRRAQAEEGLKQLTHLFKYAGWGMVIVDPETDRIKSVNPSFAIMHGYKMAEMDDMNLEDLFAPESRADLPRYARIVHEKGHYVYESLHQRKDGSVFPCLSSVTVIKDESDEIIFRATNCEDITEQKAADSALNAKKEQLEERVHERTRELQKMVNLMADREIRMVELKNEITTLRQQLEQARSKTAFRKGDLVG